MYEPILMTMQVIHAVKIQIEKFKMEKYRDNLCMILLRAMDYKDI